MAELKRQVSGEVPASLVAPPKEDVWGSTLKSVLESDANIQKQKMLFEQDQERNRQMDEGLEATRQAQEATARRTTDAELVFNVQKSKGTSNVTGDGNAPVALSEQDMADVEEIRASMKRNKDGMMQGATTHTESLINQELILKRAIQRRPWLRDEFIKASTGFLGVDVYQRGYMALAENEAARLTANDAAEKARREKEEQIGKNLRSAGWLDSADAITLNDPAFQQELNAARYDDGALARLYDRINNTEVGRQINMAQSILKTSGRAAEFANAQNTVEEKGIAGEMKNMTASMSKEFSTVTDSILADESMWDAQGYIKPEMADKLRGQLDAQYAAISRYENDLILKRVSPTVAKANADVYRASLDGLTNMLTGKTTERINKDILARQLSQSSLAASTSPSVQAMSLYLMKYLGPGANIESVQNIAFSMAGAPGTTGNSQVALQTVTGPWADRVSTTLRENAGFIQNPGLSPSEQSIARQALSTAGKGTVINLSIISPEDYAKTFGAMGKAKEQLQDFAQAFLAPSNVGEGENGVAFLEQLPEAEQGQIAGAFAKSLYQLQEGLIKKSEMNSQLAAFRKNNTDGTPVLKYAVDGSIIITDETQFRDGNPAEQAYLAEIKAHNQYLKRIQAKKLIEAGLGRPLESGDKKAIMSTNYSVQGLVSPNGSVVSGFRAVNMRDGGGPKKAQGAPAPQTGTRVFKAGDRDSLIGYAEGLRGAESSNNFNVQYGGKKVPVTDMTVAQVLAYQDAQKAAGGQTAIGAYQFTRDTLKDAMKRAGVSETDKFDVRTQNRIMKAHSEFLAEQAKSALGRDPTYGEMYLLHFQGEGDGKAMLAAGPNAPVDQWFSGREKELNPAYAKARTVGELVAILERKWS